MSLTLFLDDMPERIPLMRRGEEVRFVRNGREFAAWLREHGTPDVISFDHDLSELQAATGQYVRGEFNGEDCARWCIDRGYIPKRVIVHSWNHAGAQRIADLFRRIGHKAVTVQFFNPHKPLLCGE